MHGEEIKYVQEAYDTNWMSTVGANINEVERLAAESLGATYKGVQTGSFGSFNTISFNGNKIITGSAGGCFLTNSKEAAEKVRKWSTQARKAASWYEHEELGYNYRM